MTVRPILDGILVRMEPPAEMTAGGLHIPDVARADVGTWRAQRQAKIGVVLAVGPGRRRPRRTGWERDPRKQGLLKPEEVARKFDLAAERGALLPLGVSVGDRVLFDNAADLRPVDDADPLVRMGAAYQVAAVLDTAESRGGVEYERTESTGAALHFAAAAAWGAVAIAEGVGGVALKAAEDEGE